MILVAVHIVMQLPNRNVDSGTLHLGSKEPLFDMDHTFIFHSVNLQYFMFVYKLISSI